jgi:hypothetical protein
MSLANAYLDARAFADLPKISNDSADKKIYLYECIMQLYGNLNPVENA